ncbi:MULTISPECIES: sensor histidine kinase [Streptacidiphilus]|uniref:Sensor histidine kinase n=1 Tax=Streptacidiphilus cavernicola TaxID=3342716 RepID=A0ABV6UEE4_9ACTN|nr:sensor histidine kinase [Streptacidiphilus jeojiense]
MSGTEDTERTGNPAATAVDDSWAGRVFLMWHAAFAFLIAVMALNFYGDGTSWIPYALLGVVALAYLVFLVPALKQDRGQGIAYLAVAFPATLALGYLEANGLTILYAVFPQLLGCLRDRRIRYPVVAVLAVGSVLVSRHQHDVATALVNVVLALLITLLLGTFTQIMMREAERRGALIRELETVRADLDDAHRTAGVLAERQRLSHEIHDTLAQGFTSLLMLIQAADATVEKDPAATRQRLALAEATARDNLAEARALVAALAPAPLQGMPLDLALERVCARTGDELGLPVAARVLGTPRELPADVQVVLLRAAQEALSNVRKHAAAGSADVRLTYRPVGVLLEVVDDGRGFKPVADAPEGSYGLRGMRARVEQVHGTLEITSAPGQGTTVRVEVP